MIGRIYSCHTGNCKLCQSWCMFIVCMVPSMAIASTAVCLTCIVICTVPSKVIDSTAICLPCIDICTVPSMVIALTFVWFLVW